MRSEVLLSDEYFFGDRLNTSSKLKFLSTWNLPRCTWLAHSNNWSLSWFSFRLNKKPLFFLVTGCECKASCSFLSRGFWCCVSLQNPSSVTHWGSVGGSWCGLAGRHWALAGTHVTGDKQRSCPFLFTGHFKVTLKLSVGFWAALRDFWGEP